MSDDFATSKCPSSGLDLWLRVVIGGDFGHFLHFWFFVRRPVRRPVWQPVQLSAKSHKCKHHRSLPPIFMAHRLSFTSYRSNKLENAALVGLGCALDLHMTFLPDRYVLCGNQHSVSYGGPRHSSGAVVGWRAGSLYDRHAMRHRGSGQCHI